MRMHNPPHPGEVLGGLHIEPAGLTVTAVSERLGVDRKTLSRIINKHSPVTVAMALRLGKGFNTSPDLWLGLQQDYDLWHAEKEMDVSFIVPFTTDGDGDSDYVP